MTGAAYYMRFDELVGVIGEIAAVKLVGAMGGTRFYVREHIPVDSPIAAAIGIEAAQHLAEHIATGVGGLVVEIPRGPSSQMAQYRTRLLETVAKAGMTERQIAAELNVHGRTVRRARKKLREVADDDQGQLF